MAEERRRCYLQHPGSRKPFPPPGLRIDVVGITTAAGGALLVAFLITLLEMTDVVALVYALGAGARTMRPGFTGAVLGVALVAVAGAVVSENVLINQGPDALTHAVGTVMLWAFAFLLLRSTNKTYVKEARKRAGKKEAKKAYPAPESLTPRDLFMTGFTVGIGEAMEALVPLLGLTAQGWQVEVLAGAILGGCVIVIVGFFLHEHVKKVKVPTLKWATTSLLFAFAVLYTWEALGELHLVWYTAYFDGVPNDVLLLPLFFAALLFVRWETDYVVAKDRSGKDPRERSPA